MNTWPIFVSISFLLVSSSKILDEHHVLIDHRFDCTVFSYLAKFLANLDAQYELLFGANDFNNDNIGRKTQREHITTNMSNIVCLFFVRYQRSIAENHTIHENIATFDCVAYWRSNAQSQGTIVSGHCHVHVCIRNEHRMCSSSFMDIVVARHHSCPILVVHLDPKKIHRRHFYPSSR
jgi:hypothetical protein